MKDRESDSKLSCEHCGGAMCPQIESDDRDKRLVYACDDCGCRWAEGMILTHKGKRCPVHGTDAQLTAVGRAARWLADRDDAKPVSTRF